ncbi:MAG: hypothetical protein KGK18_16600, partial [Burkholderiales bacterium]|nr:hypothetical protein [Burkholderiales bacterium]
MTMRFKNLLPVWMLCALLGIAAAPLRAEPIVPTRDDQVIDVLPAISGSRAEQRRLRGQLAQQPH